MYDLDDETDEGDEEPSDTEGPGDEDVDRGRSADTDPCPYCGKPIYPDAELCPYCRSYISTEDAPRRYPVWIVVGVALAILVVLYWCVR